MKLEMIFVLTEASKRCCHKSKDEIYSLYKRYIVKLNLPPKQYEAAIKKLCDILEY